jgi:hypothetical protein
VSCTTNTSTASNQAAIESLFRPHFLAGSLGQPQLSPNTPTQISPKMFCTTLRRRPSYASSLPSLVGTNGLKLRGELHRLLSYRTLNLRPQRTGWKPTTLRSHCALRSTPAQQILKLRASSESSFWRLLGRKKPLSQTRSTASTTLLL